MTVSKQLTEAVVDPQPLEVQRHVRNADRHRIKGQTVGPLADDQRRFRLLASRDLHGHRRSTSDVIRTSPRTFTVAATILVMPSDEMLRVTLATCLAWPALSASDRSVRGRPGKTRRDRAGGAVERAV